MGLKEEIKYRNEKISKKIMARKMVWNMDTRFFISVLLMLSGSSLLYDISSDLFFGVFYWTVGSNLFRKYFR